MEQSIEAATSSISTTLAVDDAQVSTERCDSDAKGGEACPTIPPLTGQADPPLQVFVDQGLVVKRQEKNTPVIIKYELGKIVRNVKHCSSHGDTGVERWAEAMAMKKSAAYELIAVVDRWDEQAFKQLVDDAGGNLKWSYVVALRKLVGAALDAKVANIKATGRLNAAKKSKRGRSRGGKKRRTSTAVVSSSAPGSAPGLKELVAYAEATATSLNRDDGTLTATPEEVESLEKQLRAVADLLETHRKIQVESAREAAQPKEPTQVGSLPSGTAVEMNPQEVAS